MFRHVFKLGLGDGSDLRMSGALAQSTRLFPLVRMTLATGLSRRKSTVTVLSQPKKVLQVRTMLGLGAANTESHILKVGLSAQAYRIMGPMA